MNDRKEEADKKATQAFILWFGGMALSAIIWFNGGTAVESLGFAGPLYIAAVIRYADAWTT